MKKLTTAQLTTENELRKAETALLNERLRAVEAAIKPVATPPTIPPVEEEPPKHPDSPPIDIPIDDKKPPIRQFSFDPVEIVKVWTDAKTVTVDGANGEDLGKLARESEQTLESYGYADKFCKVNFVNGGTFKTPYFSKPKRFIEFFKGDYRSETGEAHYGRFLYNEDDTVVTCNSMEAKLHECREDHQTNKIPTRSMLAPGGLFRIPEGESTSNITQNRNIHWLNLHLIGDETKPPKDIGLSFLGLGNAIDSSVQGCWLENTNGYGIYLGATPGEKVVGGYFERFYRGEDGKIKSETVKVGYHAKNCLVKNNLIENNLAQGFGVITGADCELSYNTVRNPGKKPFKIIDISDKGIFTTDRPHCFYNGLGVRFREIKGITNLNTSPALGVQFITVPISATEFAILTESGNPVKFNGSWTGGGFADPLCALGAAIDNEPNGNPFEVIYRVKYLHNRVDMRQSVGGYFGGLAFQMPGDLIPNADNEISYNTLIGVEGISGQMAYGIYITDNSTYDLKVVGNQVFNAGQPGLQLSGMKITADRNELNNTGSGGSPAMSATDLWDSVISNTAINLIPGGVPGNLEIIENGQNQRNLWENNQSSIIRHSDSATVADSIYRKNSGDINQNRNARNNKVE